MPSSRHLEASPRSPAEVSICAHGDFEGLHCRAGSLDCSRLHSQWSTVMPRDILAFSVYEAVYAFARPGKLGRAAFSVDARSSLRNPIQKNKKTMADAIAGTIQMERQS